MQNYQPSLQHHKKLPKSTFSGNNFAIYLKSVRVKWIFNYNTKHG